jgi:hypothetical protein
MCLGTKERRNGVTHCGPLHELEGSDQLQAASAYFFLKEPFGWVLEPVLTRLVLLK